MLERGLQYTHGPNSTHPRAVKELKCRIVPPLSNTLLVTEIIFLLNYWKLASKWFSERMEVNMEFHQNMQFTQQSTVDSEQTDKRNLIHTNYMKDT